MILNISESLRRELAEEEAQRRGQTQDEPQSSDIEEAEELVAPVVRLWKDVPLIEMLPADYRDRAQGILDSDPNASHILETCKMGVIDCWEALRRLGIPITGKPKLRLVTKLDEAPF
jgi:hypothetical protein